MITLDDLLYDLSVREFAYDTYLYGTDFERRRRSTCPTGSARALAGAEQALQPGLPPVLLPRHLADPAAPLQRAVGHRFPRRSRTTPTRSGPAATSRRTSSRSRRPPSGDPYREMRMFVYEALRRPGQENVFANATAGGTDRINGKPLMPLLCGDNPLTNTLVSKFLTLTPTQLFLLDQWARGRFVNERSEDIDAAALERPRGPGAGAGPRRARQRARRIVLPGRRDRLDRAQPGDLHRAVPDQRQPRVPPDRRRRDGSAGTGEFFPPSLSFPGDRPGSGRRHRRRPGARRSDEAQRAALAGRLQRVLESRRST